MKNSIMQLFLLVGPVIFSACSSGIKPDLTEEKKAENY
jgi:hypothetical protein